MFLSLMDESAKSIAYHYELPLHYRNNPRLPNNRYQPLQRLKRRKSKLKRNPNFFGNYKQLMDTLLETGPAKISSESAAENICWYIPHQGV